MLRLALTFFSLLSCSFLLAVTATVVAGPSVVVVWMGMASVMTGIGTTVIGALLLTKLLEDVV